MFSAVKKYLSVYKNMSVTAKATLWYTFANVLIKGISLVSTPIFTRIMSDDDFGSFSLFWSWYNMLSIFATLNLYHGAYGKGLVQFEEDKNAFASSIVGLSLTLTTVLAAIFFALKKFTSLLDFPYHLLIALFIDIAAMSVIDFWQIKERFNYKYKLCVFVSISSSILSVAFGVLAVFWANKKLEARIFTDMTVKLVFAVVLLTIVIRSGKKLFDKDYWKFGLKFNIPLLPHFLSTYALNHADRLMIGELIGNAEVGYYSIASTIASALQLFVTSLDNALQPYIYNSLKAEDYTNVRKNTRWLFLLIAVMCVLPMAFAPEIIIVFAGRSYASAIYVVPPISASVYFIFVYSMFSKVSFYNQKTQLISFASICCALINIILNYICIPKFGYIAAGYTTLVSYIALSLMHYLNYKKLMKMMQRKNSESLYDITMIMVFGILLIFIMALMATIYKYILLRYAIIIAIVLTLLINWKKIHNIIKVVNK